MAILLSFILSTSYISYYITHSFYRKAEGYYDILTNFQDSNSSDNP